MLSKDFRNVLGYVGGSSGLKDGIPVLSMGDIVDLVGDMVILRLSCVVCLGLLHSPRMHIVTRGQPLKRLCNTWTRGLCTEGGLPRAVYRA